MRTILTLSCLPLLATIATAQQPDPPGLISRLDFEHWPEDYCPGIYGMHGIPLPIGWRFVCEGQVSINPTGLYHVLYLSGAVGGWTTGSAAEFLISNIAGASASTDTPASTPFRTGLKPATWVNWRAMKIERESGSGAWPKIGGVVNHAKYNLSVDNKRNPTTNVRPLAALEDLDFRRQPAILYACLPTHDGEKWAPSALGSAKCVVAWRGTVDDVSFAGDTMSVSVREQTEEGLDVPTTPVELIGASGGVTVEDGGTLTTGARILRPDDPNLRSTGDQWWSWLFSRTDGDSGTATYAVFDSPIMRIRRHSAGTLVVQMRANTGPTWTTIGTAPALTVDTLFSVLVNYDSAATEASLYVGTETTAPTLQGAATSIPGGVYTAAPAADTGWYNSATVGTSLFTHYHFRAGNRLLDADEITDRALYVIDFLAETSITAALEFTRRFGTSVGDQSQTASAVLTSFADANGAWVASDTGEPAQTHTRLPASIGRPFAAELTALDLFFGDWTQGHEGRGRVSTDRRSPRFAAMNGTRLSATMDIRSTSTYVAAGRQVSAAAWKMVEPGAGQVLNVSLGLNAGDLTVDQLLVDPLYGMAASVALVFTVEESVVDETASVDWVGTGDWEDRNVFARLDASAVRFAVSTNATITASFAVPNSLGDDIDATTRFGPVFIERFGPVSASPTEENLNVTDDSSTDDMGWQGDGETSALKAAPEIMFSTPSPDYSSSVVFRTSTGSWTVKGGDRTPSSADFTIPSVRIADAAAIPIPARYASVRVRWGKNWAWTQSTEIANVGKFSAGDSMSSALSKQWRSVTSGTGLPELSVDYFSLKKPEAQSFADALLDIIQNGHPYKIRLNSLRQLTEVQMEPFDIIDVTWEGDPYLESGRKGLLVGFEYTNHDATLIVLFVG